MQIKTIAGALRASDRMSRTLLGLAPWVLGMAPCVSQAQDAPGGRRAWSFEPSASVQQIFTDNYRTQTVKASDAITELIAAARMSGTSGAIRGFVDYSLTGSLYARHGDENDLRHSLSSALNAELVEGMAFVDLRGTYTQQVVSAFGSQSSSLSLVNGNRNDVASIAIAPSLRGRVGGALRYEARASYEATRAKDTSAGDVDNILASLRLEGGSPGGRLGWFGDATHTVSDFLAGRRTYDDRLTVGVTYLPVRELKLGVSAGRERTDLEVLNGESTTTSGLSVEWTPTERTALAAKVDKRYFGTGHSLQFSHRTPSTVWTLSSSRDVSTSSAQGTAGFGSAYDLFFRQFASVEPDTSKRDVLVRNYLQANNINPNAVVVGGFLASAATLQNTQSASVALVGVRNTITLRATTSRSQRADGLSTSLDDLSSSSRVRQRGLSLDWSLRLTPQSTVSVAGSMQRSTGDLSSQTTTLKSVTASWSSTLGPRSGVSAGARYADFTSTTVPYEESALFAAFRYAF